MIFLSETKLSSSEFGRIKSKLRDFEGLAVDSMGRAGGLALMWRKDVDVVLRTMSVHHIDVVVRGGLGEDEWRLTGFYGWPETQCRHLSWKLLEDLAGQSHLPWAWLGDFNEILRGSEKKGGVDRAEWQMVNFRSAVDVCGFREVPFSGYEFTYDNGRELAENRQTRLDRAFATDEWFTSFPEAHLYNLDREWSDHAPIKLTLWRQKGRMALGEKPFRFEQFWVAEEECEGVIENAWRGGYSLDSKLAMCTDNLKAWSEDKFCPIFRELKKKRRALRKLNKGGLSRDEGEKRRSLVRDIEGLVRHEEAYWRQRSRVLWLKEGDRNSKFFHQRASGRKRRNTIRKLIDEEGMEHVGDEALGAVAVDYFKIIFSSSNPPQIDRALQDFQPRVTAEMNEGLQADYSKIIVRRRYRLR